MTTGTLTLTEFLLARIAEDEADVLAANDIFASGPVAAEEALARVLDEDRARAECEAKRRIVEFYTVAIDEDDSRDVIAAYRDAVEVLALPYADHDDYRDEWRP